MAFIMGTWLLAGTLFVCIGALAYCRLGMAIQEAKDLFACFWIGWACTIAFLQLWHLWCPIDICVWVIPAVIGVAGCFRHGRDISGVVARSLAGHPLAMMLFFCLALWAANHAMAPLSTYDAGLYHLSAIRWANTYPIVPGLGNLHGRLAFNSSFFLYTAMLNAGPWSGNGYYLANSLLVVVLLAQMWVSLARTVRRARGARPDPADVFVAALLMPTLVYVLGYGLSSTTNDLPVFLLEVVVPTQVLRMVLRQRGSTRDDAFDLLFITLMSATGVVVKLSFLPVGVAAAAVALVVFVIRQRGSVKCGRKTAALLAATILLTILPWMVRGIILSGYPAYPITALSVPVLWKVPSAAARLEAQAVTGWARAPGPAYLASLGTWAWVPSWWARTRHDLMLPLLIAAALCVPALLAVRRRGEAVSTWIAFFVPVSIGIVAWFLTAPDPALPTPCSGQPPQACWPVLFRP
jgi:hypothetical protein